MFGRFQRSLTGLLALLAVAAQANDGYLRTSGPVPLRFQEPARPSPPPRPLPPLMPVEQPPAPTAPPVTSTSPGSLEPLGPPAPASGLAAATPASGFQTGLNSSTNRIDAMMRPLTPEGEAVSPQALIGYFQPRAMGPGRSAGSAVILAPAVFTPAQPAVPQPSSATYTVKP